MTESITTTITDAMIERAARTYVRAVQSTWDDVSPNFKSADWKTFEDETWQKKRKPYARRWRLHCHEN